MKPNRTKALQNPGQCIRFLAALLLSTAAAGPSFSTEESRFIENPRQLIYEGRRSGEGYFSSDGSKLIFQSERDPENPFFQIYLLDLETGDSHRVSPGRGKTTCSFVHPAGGKVLYASTHLDPRSVEKQNDEIAFRNSGQSRRYSWDYDEHFDLFAAQIDGRRPRRLTNSRGYDAEGSFSPDGSKIAFCSMRQAYPSDGLNDRERQLLEVDPAYFGEIYLMNSDGSNPVRLTDWPGYDGGPFFSPDGQRIVWRHFEENGAVADIYTMKLDGSGLRRLTAFESMSWAPYFHPTQEYVIFATNKHGFANFELFIVDPLGKRAPVRVTYTDGFDGLPVFSPDGNRLCWTTNRGGGGSQLYLANWNHEAALAALAASPANPKSLTVTVRPHPERASAGQPKSTLAPEAPSPLARGEKLSPEIRGSELRTMVEYLASDEMEGRMTGSSGTRKSGDAIARYLGDLGVQPLGDEGTFFHEFEYTAGLEIVTEENELALLIGEETTRFEVDQDFRPLAVTSNEEVSGEVVFVGYGLNVPGPQKASYDSYGDVDVRDKIVLALRYVPENVPLERRQELNVYSGLRYKAMVARERGAKALLVVTGPNSPNAGQLAPLTVDSSLAGSGIVAASITSRVAEALLAPAGLDLQTVQNSLDTESGKQPDPFSLPGTQIRLRTSLERIKKTDRNIVGYLPPTGPDRDQPLLMLGGHYDHIGRGEAGGSLARKGEAGQVHNGADDNASGTALVLELAARFAAEHRTGETVFPYGVVFSFWSGEEIGLIGSSAFAERPPFNLGRLKAYLNFDMVGRLRDNRLVLQGTGSSPGWRRHLEKRNVAAGFHLILEDDPYAPTDITSFYPQGVPVLTFFTGSHEDYNRPSDDADRLDYAGMERIGRFAEGIVRDLLRRPNPLEYQKVESQRSQRGNRENLRAYLGTIPDYASDGVTGVKLSGVGGGGPADEAGLRGGDVIVKFGGKNVTNIYDYTYALDAAKVGVPVEIVVVRDGKRQTFSVVPRARK